MYPIKYIEDNLVLNQDGEWFAYYELIPYNYSFLSPEQKMQLHEAFRRMVSVNSEGRMHALCIATESSVRERQARCKEQITGRLREQACKIIDQQTELLIESMGGEENEIGYRFFLGFKLIKNEEEVSIKKIKEAVVTTFQNFVGEVNHNLMGDFLTISNAEIRRYLKLEKLLNSRISKQFRLRRLESKDFGYIVEHLYGLKKTPYYQYAYEFPTERLEEKTIVKKYDMLRLTRCLLEEHQKHVKLQREDEKSYAAYLTINTIVGELDFLSSEILYYQQSGLRFPVDVSMNIEIIGNRKALTIVRNKKKELKDLDDHAWSSGNETENSVVEALDSVGELEEELGQSREAIYKLSYVVRVSADTQEELEQCVVEVRDFYDNNFGVKLVRPFGDMLGLHQECIPAGKRYLNDYVQYVTADFFSALGFGASKILGDEEGIYLGYNSGTGKNVYLDPALPCQGIKGTITNALSIAILGSLGGGKSLIAKLLTYFGVLRGGKALVIDPKSEYGKWKEKLPELADEINIVNLTSEEMYRGVLDPFVIIQNVEDADRLATDILTFLTGISTMDGKKFPLLKSAITKVKKSETRGLFLVIEELRKMEKEEAENIAVHIESFVDCGFAKLLFSDGQTKQTISLEKQLNVIQVQDLVLPEIGTNPAEYTSVERLSVAMMIVISTFALDFIHSERDVYKIVNLDEAWSFLQVTQGKVLADKLVRAGRSMQAGVYFVTQNSDDLRDETIKNNIGVKFAFRSTDIVEIKKTLVFLGLDPEDENNQNTLRNLENGQCLMQDSNGRVGVLNVQYLLWHLFQALDTRPPRRQGD